MEARAVDRYRAMQVFVRVAELQSFTQAADSLSLPKATVTTAVQDLEALVDAKLLSRTTRSVQLTADGAVFLERCKDILSDVEETESMFKSDPGQIKGTIRVDMTVPIARDFFLPLLPQFLAQHPEVEIELSSTDRRVDLLREGIDCVIRAGKYTERGLAEREVGTMAVVNAASPSYLRRYGRPESLEALKDHKLIYYAQNFGGTPDAFVYFDGETSREIKMPGNITVNTIDAYKAACVAGLGICQNPVNGILRELERGELVEILPDFRAEPMKIKLVYPHRRSLAKRVRVFMDWLEPHLKDFIGRA